MKVFFAKSGHPRCSSVASVPLGFEKKLTILLRREYVGCVKDSTIIQHPDVVSKEVGATTVTLQLTVVESSLVSATAEASDSRSGAFSERSLVHLRSSTTVAGSDPQYVFFVNSMVWSNFSPNPCPWFNFTLQKSVLCVVRCTAESLLLLA